MMAPTGPARPRAGRAEVTGCEDLVRRCRLCTSSGGHTNRPATCCCRPCPCRRRGAGSKNQDHGIHHSRSRRWTRYGVVKHLHQGLPLLRAQYDGTTKAGAYMTEADGKAKGAHADAGKPCS